MITLRIYRVSNKEMTINCKQITADHMNLNKIKQFNKNKLAALNLLNQL